MLAQRETPHGIDFRKDVVPVLQQNCVECHGGVLQMAGLRLDERHFVLEGGDSGSPIIPGNSTESLLIKRLVDKELGIIMPPSFPLSQEKSPGCTNKSSFSSCGSNRARSGPMEFPLAPASGSTPEDQRARTVRRHTLRQKTGRGRNARRH